MIMEIHSVYGVLKCTPMTLQAIEKSIPEGQDATNKDLEVAINLTDDSEASAEVATEETTPNSP